MLRGHFVSREQARRDAEFEVLKKQVGLFWGLVEKHMTTVLHSPHTPHLDHLLEKYEHGLTQEEAEELARMLLNIINNPKEPQGNRASAVFLLGAVDLRYELNLAPC